MKTKLFSPLNIMARSQFKPILLELTAQELLNANVLVLPRIAAKPYTDEEKAIIEDFLRHGGAVIVVFGFSQHERANDLAEDYLRSNDAELGYESKAAITGAKFASAWFRKFELEFAPDTSQSYLNVAAGEGWEPLIIDEEKQDRAYAATRRVGRGRILFLTDSVSLGHGWGSGRRYNCRFWTRIFEAIAMSCRRVDESKPFAETPLTSGCCHTIKHGDIPVYFGKRFEEGAKKFCSEMDELLPYIRDELGEAYCPPENFCFLAKGSARNGGREYSHRDQLTICQIDVDREDVSPVEECLMDTHCQEAWFLNHFYDRQDCDYAKWLGENTQFFQAFKNYQMYKILKRAGNKRKEWDDLAERYRMAFEKQGDRANFCKIFSILEALDGKRELDGKVMRKFLKRVARRVEDGDFVEHVTEDQAAKIFSEVIYPMQLRKFRGTPHLADKYVFSVFTNNGIQVSVTNVKFEVAHTPKDIPWIWEHKRDVHPAVKKIWLNEGLTMEFIGCPEGKFNMAGRATNSVHREDYHAVTLSHRFWLGKCQVTKGQWNEVMPRSKRRILNESDKILGGLSAAADGLTPKDVQEFCDEMNKRFGTLIRGGYEFRLPTDAEWEYALNAGRRWIHEGGIFTGLSLYDAEQIASLSKEREELLRSYHIKIKALKDIPMGKVCMKRPNAWGFYDLIGNGWELVCDRIWVPREYEADITNREVMNLMMPYAEEEMDPCGYRKEKGAVDYALWRGGDFLAGKGCGKRLLPRKLRQIERDSTFRLCIGPKLDRLR